MYILLVQLGQLTFLAFIFDVIKCIIILPIIIIIYLSLLLFIYHYYYLSIIIIICLSLLLFGPDIIQSKFVHSFLKTTFLHVLCYPVIVSRKYIYVFRSLHLPLDTQFWTRGFPLVIRSRKSGLTLATRAWKRELCP